MTGRIELHPSASKAPTAARRMPSERDVFAAALRAQQAIIDEQAAAMEAWLLEHDTPGHRVREERDAA
jgi:hypothetical protein